VVTHPDLKSSNGHEGTKLDFNATFSLIWVDRCRQSDLYAAMYFHPADAKPDRLAIQFHDLPPPPTTVAKLGGKRLIELNDSK
jgi:hypothetical protein